MIKNRQESIVKHVALFIYISPKFKIFYYEEDTCKNLMKEIRE